jgi:DNA primase
MFQRSIKELIEVVGMLKRRCLRRWYIVNIAEQIKDRLRIREVCERYGMYFDGKGRALCSFHDDRRPSASIKNNRYRCYVCNLNLGVIDFVMRLFNLTFPQAVIRLNTDFGLGLAMGRPDPTAMARARRDRAARERVGRLDAVGYNLALTEYWCLRRTMETTRPIDPDEPYSPAWCWAVNRIDAVEEEVAGWTKR